MSARRQHGPTWEELEAFLERVDQGEPYALAMWNGMRPTGRRGWLDAMELRFIVEARGAEAPA